MLIGYLDYIKKKKKQPPPEHIAVPAVAFTQRFS